MKDIRPYRVYAIKKGTVIDHINTGTALKVIDLLGLHNYDNIVTVGMRLDSKKVGKKDIVKIENTELTIDQLNKIALLAPNASINIIEDHKVSKKFKVETPNIIENIIKCRNPNCITRNEPVSSKFEKLSENPLRVKCVFCEKVFINFELL